jgi:hypothetical protein
MPESVTDRPTKAHEYLFLLSKAERYFYDAAAIAEESLEVSILRAQRARHETYALKARSGNKERRLADGGDGERTADHLGSSVPWEGATRNKRTVWTIATTPFPEAHFAVYPPALVEPCILAGSAVGNTVLDPFAGAGTTGLVASRLNRDFVGIELNPAYAEMASGRIEQDAPLLNEVTG